VYYAGDVAEVMRPDHTACAAQGQRWINPVSLKDYVNSEIAEQMHPNTLGYAAMTTALVQWSQQAKELPGPFQLPRDSVPLGDSWYANMASSLNQWTVPDDPVEVDMDAEPSDIYHQAAPEQPLRVTASGLAPDSNVRVTMYSLPRALGNLATDEEGRVDARVLVPADVVRGEHTLVMEGIDPNGDLVVRSQGVDVVRPLPWWGWLVLVGSLGAAVVAGVLQWRMREGPGRHKDSGH
jgi:hypothetical protein